LVVDDFVGYFFDVEGGEFWVVHFGKYQEIALNDMQVGCGGSGIP